jgi:radical SAM-linked protein
MEAVAPSREPEPLRVLRRGSLQAPFPKKNSWLKELQEDHLCEEALELLRSVQREAGAGTLPAGLLAELTELARRERDRRSARHPFDTRRCPLLLRFRKDGESRDFDSGDLHAIFLQGFRLEGILLALDLGKRPRPCLRVDLPLPAGVEGTTEILEVVLKVAPQEPLREWVGRVNRRLPQGLALVEAEMVPNHASPALDLAECSHWAWACPAPLQGQVREGLKAFMGSESFLWAKGQARADQGQDLRAFVLEAHWEGEVLLFTTRMGPMAATNPAKALGAILGWAPQAITGLVRTAIDLRPDPRLAHADRYAPKLKNLYEDAVLLGGASNIVLVDEEDDEPLRLG